MMTGRHLKHGSAPLDGRGGAPEAQRKLAGGATTGIVRAPHLDDGRHQ